MTFRPPALALLLLLVAGCATQQAFDRNQPVSVIAFGSCIDTNSHPMLDTFLKQHWNVAVMLGDNIYADTPDMDLMRAKYARLEANEQF